MANDPRSFTEKAAEQYAATQGLNPAQGMSQAQISAYNQQLWQQMSNAGLHRLSAAAQQQKQAQQRHMWMWHGVAMSIEDFAQHAYGDSPERTHFLLKYKDVV